MVTAGGPARKDQDGPDLLPHSVGLSGLCPLHQGARRFYTSGMSRVADEMRREQEQRLARMTPGERMAEALRLGQEAITAYAAAHGLDREEARRRLKRAAQVGRRPSRVMLEIIE
jgi:hypothetical protein